jgi:hypothetical protein
MKKRILVSIGSMTVLGIVGFAFTATGATLGAIGGRVWLNSDASCINIASFSSAVSNTCARSISYLVPLQTQSNSTQTYAFRASSTVGVNTDIGTPPTCRTVVLTKDSASRILGPSTVVWNDSSLGSASVPTSSTAQIDCILPGTNSVVPWALSSVRFF